MPRSAKLCISIGAVAALIGVALGAFGAHALKGHLGGDMLVVWRTAVEYQMVHALGLFAVGLLALHLPKSAPLKWAGFLMAAGIVLFSGSLYVLALTGMRGLGAITPFGGLAFIAGWAALVWAVLRG
ncbi:MAG: DUF423 domain-containing protein [Betaproteobacteria bacterium]|nr:DUF423 domain-containing protein [Betaproteobacteria bacterium]